MTNKSNMNYSDFPSGDKRRLLARLQSLNPPRPIEHMTAEERRARLLEIAADIQRRRYPGEPPPADTPERRAMIERIFGQIEAAVESPEVPPIVVDNQPLSRADYVVQMAVFEELITLCCEVAGVDPAVEIKGFREPDEFKRLDDTH